MILRTHPSSLVLAALAAALSLSACERHPDETVGQAVDRTIEKSGEEASRASSAARDAAKDATSALQEAARQSGNAVDDAAITATVKTEIVRDPELSALSINVDTAKGEVTLRGEAPNAAARDRARQIAASVKGVTKVNNELTLKAKS